MDAFYLHGSVFRDLWHEHDMKEILISKSSDRRGTLCEECFCQGAESSQINRTLRPLDLSKERATPVKCLGDDIPFRSFTVPEAAGRLPVASLSETRMLGSA